MESPQTVPTPTGLAIDLSTSSLLFPREEEIKQLMHRLRNQYLITVSGNVQSGKSVLVREGLVPRLNGNLQGQNGTDWRVAFCRPGTDPIANLSNALTRPNVLKNARELETDYNRQVKSILEEGGNGLVKVFEDAQENSGQQFNLLVVVDQLEDIFRFEKLMKDRDGVGTNVDFLNLLSNAVRRKDMAIYVLLNFDHQYINRTTLYPGLIKEISRSSYPFPTLGTQEIITGLKDILDMKVPETKKLILQFARDIQRSQRDPFLLSKVHHTLIRTIALWQQTDEGKEPLGLKHYHAVGGLSNAMKKHAEAIYKELVAEEVSHKDFSRLFQLHPEDSKKELVIDKTAEKIFNRIFRLLTRKNGNRIQRRPVLLGEILDHFDSEEDKIAMDIIQRFHWSRPEFLEIISSSQRAGQGLSLRDLSRKDAIIDIVQIPILRDWERLREQAFLEAHDADVYTRLFQTARLKKEADLENAQAPQEKETQPPPSPSQPAKEGKEEEDDLSAIKFFSSLKNQIKQVKDSFASSFNPKDEDSDSVVPEKQTVSLYVQPELGFVTKWKKESQPTAVWAERYVSDKRYQTVKKYHQQPFQLAMDFLEESKKKEQYDKDQQERKDEKDSRNKELTQRIIRWMGIIAAVLAIYAFYKGSQARENLNNIRLLNFVDALTDAQAIISEPEKISDLKQTIVEKKVIDNNEKVIDFLYQNKVLFFDQEDADYYDDLLNSIDQLYDELRLKGQGTLEMKDIDASAKIAINAYDELQLNHDATYQFPIAYKALYAHLEAYKNHSRFNPDSENNHVYSHVHESLIGSLASNPHSSKASEFAFGDRKGNVYVMTTLAENLGPNTPEDYRISLEAGNSNITALAYSKDGTLLASGSNSGKVTVWQLYEPDDMEVIPEPINEPFLNIPYLNSTVQFLAFLNDDQELLIATEKRVYIYDRSGKRKLRKSIEPAISSIALNVDQDLVAIGRPDTVEVFDLAPTRQGYSLGSKALITLPRDSLEITVSSLAFGPTDHLAIGSEIGNIWIAKGKDGYFDKLRELIKTHTSTITNLAFNQRGIRLVSSSLDGSMVIWNYAQLENQEEFIWLTEGGSGIWDFCFINEAELLAAENIYLRIWYSNAQSLRNEVNKYVQMQ